MYAVCVTFQLKPGAHADFMPLMEENARMSRQNEPGCHRFDVLSNAGKPEAVFLYELYTDRAAFDAHLASEHFRSFDAAVADMITNKTLQTWDTVQQ